MFKLMRLNALGGLLDAVIWMLGGRKPAQPSFRASVFHTQEEADADMERFKMRSRNG